MGHEDTDTTKGYIYNYNEIENNRACMDKALEQFKYVKDVAYMIIETKEQESLI